MHIIFDTVHSVPDMNNMYHLQTFKEYFPELQHTQMDKLNPINTLILFESVTNASIYVSVLK